MKFTVERDVLNDAVTWVARALPSRPPIPVLAGVMITADTDEGGQLRLSTFDYEVSAKVELAADVFEGGTILVSGKLLAEICRLLPPKPVELSVDGPKALLTCGASKFTLLTMPVDEYPNLPVMPTPCGSIDGSVFTEAVAQVSVAASRDETNPRLTGVKLEIEGDRLAFMSTDRYRLALAEAPWKPSDPSFSGTALIRAKVLSDVAKSLATSGELQLALSDGPNPELIGFETAGRHTTSSLIDATDYPQVRRLFPESSPIHVVIETSMLIEAARRVSLVAERNTPLRLTMDEGTVTLEAGSGDEAQANESIEAILTGEPIAVAFNPTYLLDGLGVITSKYVRMSLSHPNKPVLFAGQDEAESEPSGAYEYLLVPIRFAA